MATGNMISCKQYQNFLVTQEPVYDKEILKDIRPTDGFLMGYYLAGAFDAYTGTSHTFHRFNHVFPNVTSPWEAVASGNCNGTPCDPDENKIGWGWTSQTYALEGQSWGSQILCFDDLMTKTKAKEHFRQIIDDILRPATSWIMSFYLQRKAAELAGKKFVVATGLPQFTFTWEAGGYEYINVVLASDGVTATNPTGKLTPNILRSRVRRQYFLGAILAGKEGFDRLELHTDQDTFHDLCKEDAFLKTAWRFGDFGPANKEFWSYGFSGYVGDFMVKVLQFPLRFNKVASGRYQVVLPYENVAAEEGSKSEFNEDYDNAQYQFSYINNKRALRVMPFNPEAINQQMPFMVRDYGGKWRFVMNDLGGDCNGKPIDNSRGNKGKFIADFRLSVKPEHTEWLEVIFHKVDKPCITIVDVCNADPGSPAQSRTYENAPCPTMLVFQATAAADTSFEVPANSIRCNGNVVTHALIDSADLPALVIALQARFDTAGLDGTWAVYNASTNELKLTYTSAETVCADLEIPFDLA